MTHGGECVGPVPEAGMLRWGGGSSSLRGHAPSCEWRPEAHSWGLGGTALSGQRAASCVPANRLSRPCGWQLPGPWS